VCYDVTRASVELFTWQGHSVKYQPDDLLAGNYPIWHGVGEPEGMLLGLAARRTTEAGTAWLLGLVQGMRQAEPRFEPYSPDGYGGARAWQQGWLYRWADPAVLIEAYPRTAADLTALTAAVDHLLRWYREHLLGKTVAESVGRPKEDEQRLIAEFLALYEPAYRRAWRDLDRLPQEHEVAGEMGYSPATYYRRKQLLKKHNIPLPQITAPAP
jgi:hypothetical protein